MSKVFRTYKLPAVPVIIQTVFTLPSELPTTDVLKLEQLTSGDTLYVCLPHSYIKCLIV